MTEDVAEPSERSVLTGIEVTTVFVDGLIGSARAGGVHRLLFGDYVHSLGPDAAMPASRAVLNMVIPSAAIPTLISELQSLEGVPFDE